MLISRFNNIKGPLLLLIAVSMLSVNSCDTKTVPNTDSFQILSPSPNWSYSDDEYITFSANVNTNRIHWASSIDGEIGDGNSIYGHLSPGTHQITASFDNINLSCLINVTHHVIKSGDDITLLANKNDTKKFLPIGSYYPYALTCSLSISSLSINAVDTHTQQVDNGDGKEPTRDFRANMPLKGVFRSVARSAATSKKNRELGDAYTFRVINTAKQYDSPHLVNASLRYISDTVYAWTDDLSIVDNTLLRSICSEIEKHIIPRVQGIWGNWADIDEDNHISILFSSSINEEGIATGFFNPCDFYARITDTNSDSYNPSSNEMDILYLAIPNSDPSSSYFQQTIIATIAHELTHAINFTRKTWSKQIKGNSDARQEELFLDEGWSHLSESICGYGVSGGNLEFLNVFLADTGKYSLCKKSLNGLDDTAGRRGGMALFLYWLFNKKGGMKWNLSNSIIPVDNGGIAFLQKMTNSDESGWDSIGEAYGSNTRELFIEFVNDINKASAYNIPTENLIDPLTGEPINISVNMGNMQYGTTSISVLLPELSDPKSSDTINLEPWSFVLLKPITVSNARDIVITHKSENTDAYVRLLFQ